MKREIVSILLLATVILAFQLPHVAGQVCYVTGLDVTFSGNFVAGGTIVTITRFLVTCQEVKPQIVQVQMRDTISHLVLSTVTVNRTLTTEGIVNRGIVPNNTRTMNLEITVSVPSIPTFGAISITFPVSVNPMYYYPSTVTNATQQPPPECIGKQNACS